MAHERILLELQKLRDKGIIADLILDGSRPVVVYRNVPTPEPVESPADVDVIVPVPDGYPAGMIDLAGLDADHSDLLARTKGGTNIQQEIQADGKAWRTVSYHPHSNGGGPPWDPTRHGFHTYYDHLVAWLHALA